jgi:hypothetical protein
LRKRWGPDASADTFIHHARVAGFFVGHIAFHDTDGSALCGPASCVESADTDDGACAVRGCVVLPTH